LRAAGYQIMACSAMYRLALLAALALAGCSPAGPAEKPPLAGATIGGPFTLVDGGGRSVSDREFEGRYRIMYFGYTYCPDVCPADLGKVAAAMKILRASDPQLAGDVVPIFVTVDPSRDTPAVVRDYVRSFDPAMYGLTGSQAAVDRVAKEWAVYAKRGATTPGGGYLVQHSAVAYLMGKAGEPLAILPTDSTPQAVADEIRRWAR
jgi:protein SCO1